MVIAGLSLIMALGLAFLAGRRKAAVGRVELRTFLFAYALHSGLSIVTMSSILEQGSTALAVLSSIHVAVVVALFWILLGNALVATQVVELVKIPIVRSELICRDGTAAALVPLGVFTVLFFIPPFYISLDTALDWTDAFEPSANNVRDLKATALFILTLLWPAL